MGVVASEDPWCRHCSGDCQATKCASVVEAGSACSDFLADPPQAPKARSTSLWFILLAPLIFAYLAMIECLPTTRAGWTILALALGPLDAVGAVALLALYY